MPNFSFGSRSRNCLAGCDDRWALIATQALQNTPIDFGVIWGFRWQKQQDELVEIGASKTLWPTSEHNYMLSGTRYSQAIDFIPYHNGNQVDWKDERAFALIAGVFMSAAISLGDVYHLRWGGDWDGDGHTRDQTFNDLGHLELLNKP